MIGGGGRNKVHERPGLAVAIHHDVRRAPQVPAAIFVRFDTNEHGFARIQDRLCRLPAIHVVVEVVLVADARNVAVHMRAAHRRAIEDVRVINRIGAADPAHETEDIRRRAGLAVGQRLATGEGELGEGRVVVEQNEALARLQFHGRIRPRAEREVIGQPLRRLLELVHQGAIRHTAVQRVAQHVTDEVVHAVAKRVGEEIETHHDGHRDAGGIVPILIRHAVVTAVGAATHRPGVGHQARFGIQAGVRRRQGEGLAILTTAGQHQPR